MATWVLSECCVRPIPRISSYPKPRFTILNSPVSNSTLFKTNKPITFNPLFSRVKDRNLGLKVSAPAKIQFVDEDDSEITNGFNPGAPPPFTLADIRAAIPKHCWVKDPWKSMSYVVRDVVVVFGLAAVAAFFNNIVVWPLYWIAQSTMFWALFVLGHDCGHGSFSNDTKLNSVVGHILHSSILVPYHGWRISHRTHHQNHGHVENDESWHPLSEKIYRNLDKATRTLRFTLPFPMLAYPFYLNLGSFPSPKRDFRVFAMSAVANEASTFIPAAPIFLPEGPWKQIAGGVTAAEGFKAAGMYGGLRALGQKPDLALVTCDVDAVAAGTFTKNVVAAAPVLYCKSVLEKSKTARAVLINAGQANAATGDAGYQDVIDCSNALSKLLQVSPDEILIESTGVIGQRIKKEPLLNSLPKLISLLSTSVKGADAASVAITTTDLVSKSVAVEFENLGPAITTRATFSG